MRYSLSTPRRLGLALVVSVVPAIAAAQQPITIQHARPLDQRGINVFEPPKDDTVPFKGLALSFGAAFTQQWQGLQHSNTATPNVVNNTNLNQLISIGHGFNNADANLYLNAQLARGIRVQMTTYLSARHHQETWVKDGFILIDEAPLDNALLQDIMKYVTLQVGHMEIDYGDAHFRRSDNGNAMYNPFVGNYILDAFTTEIGGEVYVRDAGWLGMVGVTGGEVHGQVTAPQKRSASVLGKLGVDKQLTPLIRARLTGSFYVNNKSASNTLFTGDRAGSRYYDVMENVSSNEQDNAWSGQIRPGFSNKIQSYVVNPFLKVQGFEFFGNYEVAKGRSAAETSLRTWHQNVYEGLYRFGGNDRFYLGGRYNTATGRLAGIANDVSVDRYQLGGGWFVTPNVLGKLEYVNQKYNDFPTTDIRNGGQFKGFMVEGVVAF